MTVSLVNRAIRDLQPCEEVLSHEPVSAAAFRRGGHCTTMLTHARCSSGAFARPLLSLRQPQGPTVNGLAGALVIGRGRSFLVERKGFLGGLQGASRAFC
jgi:hypothetical protein